ncbi:MAG: discoidin domain-containing protein, partial [Nonomuraea sp.]|nr:discoidin domain-containing protein [Nonomuraea sp.]
MSRVRWAVVTALALLAGLLVAASAAAGTAETLLSQGKPASSSSKEGTSYAAAYAFDGDLGGTRWASAEGHDPEWLRVDLGTAQQITRVKLTWEVAYAESYQIQTSSDGSTWTDVYATTSGDGDTDDLTVSATARYVRMYGTARGTEYGYSLWEMQVYGAGGTPTDPPGDTFTVAAAGDIAEQCTASSSSCVHPKTAALVEAMNPEFVITMGDNQYDDARLSDFRNY